MMQFIRSTLPVLALLLAAAMYAGAAMPAQDTSPEFVYVGTQANRIEALRLDPSNGELTHVATMSVDIRPTWLLGHPRLPVLYAVDDQSNRPGSVTAFSVNRETGALSRVGAVETHGVGSTHLTFDAPSSTLLAANYNSGSVSSIAVHDDGNVGALASTISESGSGPNRRQMSAHAHSAVVDPSGRYVLVPDLGADRVFVYGFDRATHTLSTLDAVHSHDFVMPFGSGPRHIVFGADGRFAYLITELSADVVVLRWDASQGRLSRVQSLPVSSVATSGKSGAEIAVSHDGRYVYVADRGDNEVVVYRVDQASGQLSETQRASSGGIKPWSFGIDPSGRWLLVANQGSGTVSVFAIDPATGALSNTGAPAKVSTAVSVAFSH